MSDGDIFRRFDSALREIGVSTTNGCDSSEPLRDLRKTRYTVTRVVEVVPRKKILHDVCRRIHIYLFLLS